MPKLFSRFVLNLLKSNFNNTDLWGIIKTNNNMETTTLPEPIQKQVATSGIEPSEAQIIAGQYAPLMAEIAEIEAVVKTLSVGNPADLEKAKRARIDLGRVCSRAEKQKQSDKEKVLTRGRFIDGLFNTVNGYGRLTQETAKGIEDYAERMEAERKEKLRAERVALIEPFGVPEPIGIADMTDDVFANYLTGVETAHRLRIEAEAKAKAEAEAAAEAERVRIEEQAKENARLKAEADQREKEMAAERAKMEAERMAEAERIAKIQAEVEAKAAKERSELEAKLRAEAEAKAKVEAELRAKKEAEERAEAQRKAEAERIEAERIKAAKAPIKKQLTAWVELFEAPSNQPNHEKAIEIVAKFDAFKTWAKSQIDAI